MQLFSKEDARSWFEKTGDNFRQRLGIQKGRADVGRRERGRGALACTSYIGLGRESVINYGEEGAAWWINYHGGRDLVSCFFWQNRFIYSELFLWLQRALKQGRGDLSFLY